VRSGRTSLAPTLDPDVLADLAQVRVDAEGEPDLATCSPRLRSFARAYALAARALTEDPRPQPTSAPVVSVRETTELNRELFNHLRAVFVGYTGTTPEKFLRGQRSFDAAVRGLGRTMSNRPSFAKSRFRAGGEALSALAKHYDAVGGIRFRAAAQASGMKFVLAGGSANYAQSALASTRSMLLYCDTLAIPDPVLPFLETAREAERFNHVRMLENIFYMLQLEPLVREDLPVPPIVVFPSWEGALEEKDVATRDGQERLVLDFFSHYLQTRFEDIVELVDYVDRHPRKFLECVEQNRLFVAAGGTEDEPLVDAVVRQREHVSHWRAPEYVELVKRMPRSRLVLTTILERLAPHFHARENSAELAASPLFSQRAQWHYFRLLQKTGVAPEPENSVGSLNISSALVDESLLWLGNVPIQDLVDLRRRNCNVTFRDRLREHVEFAAKESDGVRAVKHIERGVQQLISEHQNDVKKIVDDYQVKYSATAVAAWVTFAASFALWFPVPEALVTGPAAVALVAKYLSDKASETTQRRQASRTLLGCLAAAAAEAKR